MTDETSESRSTLKTIWRTALFMVGVVAVVQELRLPKDQRTWHGTVAGFVPYDFRRPTMDRLVQTYWNPEGPIISSKLLGVGWALNLGAVKKLVASKSA